VVALLLVLAVVATSAAIAGAAPYLSKQDARYVAKGLTRKACNRYSRCREWAVGRCVRITRNKVDCKAFFHDRTRHGSKYTCTQWARAERHGGQAYAHFIGRARCHNGWTG
jgi:hypothetical protein